MARDFDGIDDKAQYATEGSQFTIGAITISLWINPDNFTSGGNAARIVHKGPNARGYFEIVCDGTTTPDRVGFGRDYVTTDLVRVFAVPALKVWTNLVFTHNNGNLASGIFGYFNGVSQSPTGIDSNGTGGRTADTNVMAIGGRTFDTARAFNGRIAEVGIWNRVLKKEEITALSKGYAPTFLQRGLLFYTPIRGNNANEPDFKGGARATLTGTTKANHPRIIYPRNFSR